jgi:subtilisin family serine protease
MEVFPMKKLLLLSLICVSMVAHSKIIPNRYIVRLKGDYARMDRQSVYKSLDGLIQGMRTLSRSGEFLLVSRGEGRSFSRARMMQDLEALKRHPMVHYAEPDQWVSAWGTTPSQGEPNDPHFVKLWGLENTKFPGIDVQAKKAWKLTTGSKKVIVAVIDTGVSALADLKNNLWVNEAEKNGKKGVDDDGNGFVDDIHGYDFVNNDGDPSDDHSHGSHCAGTIGAEGNNGTDITGVAWKVQIMALKFLSRSGSGSLSNAIRSIDYAAQMGAHIMSNSWGGGGFSNALKESIEKANKKNILFVAAAGNAASDNDKRPAYPASYKVDNVVSVAALQMDGKLASFSNYGKTSVHIAAPGKDILSTTPKGLKSFSGTSMATPHVSGVAALIMSHPGVIVRGRNVVEPKKIKDLLMRSGTQLDKLQGKVASGATVNAFKALSGTRMGSRRIPWK